MSRRNSFVDSLIDGLTAFAETLGETVADRLVDEFSPVVRPVAVKPKKTRTLKRRETARSSADGAEAYRRYAASKNPENPPPSVTHYDVLQVSRSADPETIAAAHRSMVKRFHPDAWPKDKAKAEARIRAVNAAWEILGDVAKRAAYDREISGR